MLIVEEKLLPIKLCYQLNNLSGFGGPIRLILKYDKIKIKSYTINSEVIM